MGTRKNEMPVMPKRMKERFRDLFGDEYPSFEECCRDDYRKSFRINTIKAKTDEVIESLEKQGIGTENIPWIPQGFMTDEKSIGNTFEHFMGYIYIQGPSSMIPAIALDPKAGDRVLDMCAAPGSKTTQIAAMMENKGCLVANDFDYNRLKMLRFNNDKMGVLNSIITNIHGYNFGSMKLKYDKILLDAPCTGEGIIMREWDVIKRWSMKGVIGMCRLQKKLISSAIEALNPDGTLVYSTCTLSPEENEEVIDHALNEFGNIEMEKISIWGLKSRPGLTSWDRFDYDERVKNCLRVWPQDNGSEGFFIAKIRKSDS